ncbi:uncharacterized protein LOC130780645 [Actinidia eriantha]|uniref:uncharacterized protein LOC130780645 n=1 Tax=Actinidia eriantha TaxID=165200 RepID=UPI00258D0D4A|nr:uncharacterized protein LOC130780645 [Actinidia eriantha]
MTTEKNKKDREDAVAVARPAWQQPLEQLRDLRGDPSRAQNPSAQRRQNIGGHVEGGQGYLWAEPRSVALQRNKQSGHNHRAPVETDSRTVATSKRRRTPDRTGTEVDLRDTLNARWNKENLCAKLDERTVTVVGERVLTVSVARAAPSERREAVPRYQTPFSRWIEGLDPLEKFTPSRFTLYDGKLDPRSHVSHVRQVMALWNHMDALMCRVFSSSLGDLGLKWFDKLPQGLIENFHQLTESFMARFVINTKVPKGVGSLLTLRKGKNELVRNYRKQYLETYNKIEECSEELAVASYKLGLTPEERL